MRTQLLNEYNTTTKVDRYLPPTIRHNNIDGMFIEISGGVPTQYEVKFINKKSNTIEYTTTISNNCWAKTSLKYYVDWGVEIRDIHSTYQFEYNLSLQDKVVYINIESDSLGDTLAWVPFVEKFQKKHDCKLVCSTKWKHLFEAEYPDITFVLPGTHINDVYARYYLGLYYREDNTINFNFTPLYPLNRPLQQWAADILDVEYSESRPRLTTPTIDVVDEKLITIAIHSTTQAKYWNNPTGWQEVVDWLIEHGYTVKLLSRERDNYMGNPHPKGIIQHPESSIESVIGELKRSKLFIGLGSGLSWLSWALGTPTMIISGFSDPISEMQECIRITSPKNVCTGCFNRTRLIANDWHWCPDFKGTIRHYECTKTITSAQVITELRRVLPPRIQIKHLLTRPEDVREKFSIESITKLQAYGFDYQPIINEIYDKIPPKEHCRRPHHIRETAGEIPGEPGLGYITGRHYGCYLAHRNAIASIDDVKYDYTLIFEADAYLSVDVEEFVNIVYEACKISEQDNVYHISFADNVSGWKERVHPLFSKTAHYQDAAHCYLISNKHKKWWDARIIDSEWDGADLWFNHIFCHHPQLRYTTNKVYSKWAEGVSLIDNIVKGWYETKQEWK